jgi:NTE family protein
MTASAAADKSKQFALVLGGGGVTGIAWETGILKGLRDAGFDVETRADLFVGTSAGSVVATGLSADESDLDAMFALQARPWDASELQASAAIWKLAVGMIRAWRPLGTTQQRNARLGAEALRATVPLSDEARMAIIRARLPNIADWPQRRRLAITAVDCDSGALVKFTNHDSDESRVPLLDAVAASCAIPLLVRPQRIGDRHLMDGGMESPTNALLARGYERVLILAVAPAFGEFLPPLSGEVAALHAAGSHVIVIVPDKSSRKALFPNPADSRRRQAAALAGQAQGAREAARVLRELDKSIDEVRQEVAAARLRRRWFAVALLVAVVATTAVAGGRWWKVDWITNKQ